MERTFEATLVEQCAPTLEGIKPASLFRWQGGCAQALVSRWAGELAPFELHLQRMLEGLRRPHSRPTAV